MNSLFGFGGVKIIGLDGDASFYGQSSDNSTAEVKITYSPEFIKQKNINNAIVSKFLGFRISIEIDLLNIFANDWQEFRNLWQILSNTDCEPVSILANTSDGSDGLSITNVVLASSVSINQLHRLEIGQSVKLKFDKKDLVHDISSYVRGLDSDNLTFNSDNANFNSDNAIVN